MPPPSRDRAVRRPDQPRQQVLQLRQLDLPLAFARPRAAREDVENQLRAIDRPSARAVSSSCRSCAGVSSLSKITTSTSASAQAAASDATLPAADEGGGVGLRPLLQHAQDDARACGVGEARELVERMIRIAAAGRSDEADERGALDVLRHERSYR